MDPCAPTREHIRGQIAGSSVQGSRPNGMRRFFRSAGDAFKWPRLMTSSCGRRETEWRRARYTCRRASGLASGRWRALEPWNRRDPHAPQGVRVRFGSSGDTRPDALNVRSCCADAESRHSAFGQLQACRLSGTVSESGRTETQINAVERPPHPCLAMFAYEGAPFTVISPSDPLLPHDARSIATSAYPGQAGTGKTALYPACKRSIAWIAPRKLSPVW
jgi:hypothetical protein